MSARIPADLRQAARSPRNHNSPNHNLLDHSSPNHISPDQTQSSLEQEDDSELEVTALFHNAGRGLQRKFAKLNLVILAESGQKVYRSNSFFNAEFESFNDDSFHDSEYLDSMASIPLIQLPRNPRTALHRLKRKWHKLTKFTRTNVFQSVFKCSLAYLIASLGVYWGPFNHLLGNTDSKHVVATAAVYFHPARTKGSMHQLLVFVLISLTFSFVVSLTCRSISTYYFNIGQDEVSYLIDLVVSSVGLGFIAFMKQKVGKQTFNTACSLASISLVTCIVKEGSLNSNVIPMGRLLSTAQVVLVGSVISVAICYLVWPKSAVVLLRTSLNDSFNIMSSLMSITTHRFLHGEKLTAKDAEIFSLLRKKAVELKDNLEEAMFELKLLGRETEYTTYCQIVEATISLIEHSQALRSSCEMQWLLLHNNVPTENVLSSNVQRAGDDADRESVRSLSSYHSDTIRLSQSVENLGSIFPAGNSLQKGDMDYNAIYPSQLFDLFVYYLAPSIKSFVFTVKEVLGAVPFEKKFVDDAHQNVFVKSSNYQISLQKAIQLFEDKQVRSFDKLYSQDIFKPDNAMFKTDQEEVTACCGNFSSLLALYGKELIHFLQLTESFEVISKTSPRTWSWLRWWKKNEVKDRRPSRLDATFVEALRELKSQLKPMRSNVINESTSFFPTTSEIEKYRRKIWKSLSFFRRTDIQFGFRVGVGAFCISIFAFLAKTEHIFVNWRLEWSLVVYCIMMSKSVGGTTMTVKWRILGTFLGAFGAYLAWVIFDGNGAGLAITGYFLSIPCFYIIIFWKKNNAYGRFILLTYNLTALYSYSMAQKDSEDGEEGGDLPIVAEIAFHRFVSVTLGISWALTVATLFIPNSARARLKSGLTVLWLRMGVIWNSDPMDYTKTASGARLVGLKDYKGTRDLLLECQTLLKQAPVEFRLKGRFPKDIYEKLLARTSAILDAFLNLQLMIEMDSRIVPKEEYVLEYIASEREELEHRIFLIFYMVASALALGFPLPTKPASTEHAKDRMLLKLSEIRSKSATEQIQLNNEDYVLLYSYILVTSTISQELDKIIDLIKELLGDISEEIFLLV